MRVLVCSLCLTAAVSGQTLVVPANQLLADGVGRFWIGGTIQPRRQLTLIESAMLAPLQGHSLTAISFRRNAENEAFTGGNATLTVRLSHSPLTPSTASDQFASNHGTDLTTVFQGVVTLPNSPDPGTNPVTWTTDNVLRIQFQQLFPYNSGTLAIEVTGSPGASPAQWWPADAVWQPNGGNAASVGAGSGPFGGPTGEWSFLSASNIGPTGTVDFAALGVPGQLAALGIAEGTLINRLDISVFGVPGSFIHILDPFAIELAVFGAPLVTQQPTFGGMATYSARVPPLPAFLGANFGSQWFRIDPLGQIASSNAHQWSTAAQFPAIGMTLVTAPVLGAEPVIGKVVPACGHVVRFEYQ